MAGNVFESDITVETAMDFEIVLDHKNAISGLGQSVHQLIDSRNGELIAYVGEMNGREMIHFTKPISTDRLARLSTQLLNKHRVLK